MKRLIFGIICIVATVCANAQDVDYKFRTNQEGECEIIDSVEISVSNKDCYRIVKDWLYSISCVSLSFSNEKKGKSLTFNNVFYTEKRYNSFSGTYSNNLSINCDVKIENGKLYYRLYDMSLIKAYAGYGASAMNYPIAERIKKIEMAKKEKVRLQADEALSRSEKRDAIEEQDEILADAEILSKAYDVLFERIANLVSLIKW